MPEHFQAVIEYLFDTLKGCALTEDGRAAIGARVNTCADDVFDNSSAPNEQIRARRSDVDEGARFTCVK
ncbi:MAG: hypothetical protein OQK79_09625 [Rhodanobacter sp.]|jgi:truncated hemoglobin YjbI|nr:hypothetical protein [Rhodanobacter sp.]